MCTVAAGKISRFARLFASIRTLQARDYTIASIVECGELQRTLDLDAQLAQALDQEALVLILRKDQHVWKRTDSGAHVAKRDAANLFAAYPQIGGGKSQPILDQCAGKTRLLVELERA